jgi:hypothetical protein
MVSRKMSSIVHSGFKPARIVARIISAAEKTCGVLQKLTIAIKVGVGQANC